MGLSLGSSLILLIFVVAGLAALSVFVYRKTTPSLAPVKKYSLTALRFVAIAIVAFLLFRPELSNKRNSIEQPVVGLLIDNSESLKASLSDSLESSNLPDVRRLVQQLSKDARVIAYKFGTDAQEIGNELDSLTFDAQRTNMSEAIQYAVTDLTSENLQSIVLVSDGRYNTGVNPTFQSADFAIPITTVTVGDTSAFRDIRIQRVETNELAYVGITLPVDITIQANGFRGNSVSVALVSENGSVVDNAEVQLPGASEELTVPLEVTPSSEGTLSLRAVVTRVDGEETYRNNSENINLRVLKSQKRILLMASRPSPDVSTLKSLIERSENLTVSSYIQKTSNSYYEGTLTARPDTFDLALLIGFPSNTSPSIDLARLATAVESGLPTFIVLQRNTDVQRLTDALAGLLPVSLESARSGNTPALGVPTGRFGQHAITRDISTTSADIKRLPPLSVSASRWQTAPGSIKLLTTSIRGIDLEDPLVAALQRPGYRSVVVLGEGLYAWNNLPPDLEELDGFLDTFVANITTWLTAGSDERLVRVSSSEDLYGGGEPIRLSGQVYDESLNPITNATVNVDVTGPTGRDLPYIMTNDGGGRYTLSIGSLPEGKYQFSASASADGRDVGMDQGSFDVGRLSLEFRNTTADPFFMRQLATRTGGLSFLISEVDSIHTMMLAQGLLDDQLVSTESRTRLWQQYPFLILITTLLTVEWLVRKRSGLV